MTGHSRLSLLHNGRRASPRACGGGTPVPTSPSAQQSFLTGTWTGTLSIDREGEPTQFRCSDVDIRARRPARTCRRLPSRSDRRTRGCR